MICGKCGNPERDTTIEPDENGNCGVCSADNWVEWRDFKTNDLKDYIQEAANHLNISTGNLVARVYRSNDRLNERSVIEDVFEEFKL